MKRIPGKFKALYAAGVTLIGSLVLIASIGSPALSQQFTGDAMRISIRKDVKDLTSSQKAEIVAAILKAKATPDPNDPSHSYYDRFVIWHRDAFACKNSWHQDGDWAGAAHNSPTFLPWHREFLDKFETMLREMSGNPALALPYWDWTNPASTAAVFASDFMGGSGDPAQGYAVTDGPFVKGKWRIIIKDPAALQKGLTPQTSFLTRNFGHFVDTSVSLPTAAAVRGALAVNHYDHKPYNASSPLPLSFRNSLEGWRNAKLAHCDNGWTINEEVDLSPHELHNLVHIYVGGVWRVGNKLSQGTMAYNTSPNDPVFFFHHANIDRLFAAWEITSRGHYQPAAGAKQGWNANDTMWPWHDRTINSWFGTLRNGYRYASLPKM